MIYFTSMKQNIAMNSNYDHGDNEIEGHMTSICVILL